MSTTIRDVAKLANVSVATVSRVLNGTCKVSDSTRDAVLSAQKELGFYLNENARKLAKSDSDTIGILVADISDPYFASMIRTCDNIATTKGRSLLITQGFYNEHREITAINKLISNQCRSLIITALSVSDAVLSEYMERCSGMVLINRILKGYEDRCIIIDNHKAMYDLTSAMIEKGHRKIAYISSNYSILDVKQRLKGYTDALKDHGIDFDKKLVISKTPSFDGGAQAALELMKLPKDSYTALICYNDSLAAAAMSVYQNKGYRIPDDLSVCGFDDLSFSKSLYPSLTTVKHPVDEMAKIAMEMSDARSSNSFYELEKLETPVILRDSIKDI